MLRDIVGRARLIGDDCVMRGQAEKIGKAVNGDIAQPPEAAHQPGDSAIARLSGGEPWVESAVAPPLEPDPQRKAAPER